MDANGIPAAGQTSQISKASLSSRDVDSPKSVILDPRIVSPSSSSSGSMERRLPDLRRQPRHDRGYSVSDGDDYDAALRMSGLAIVSRQMSQTHYGTLESLPESHFLPPVPPKRSTSGGSSENSTPRMKIGRNVGKDSDRLSARASENEFLHRRLSSSGAETSACVSRPGAAVVDDIELNKFVVSRQCGSGPEEIMARELKPAPPYRNSREDHRKKISGEKSDGTCVGSGHVQSSKSSKVPGAPNSGHNGFSEWPRSALIELASELVLKETSKYMKDLSETHFCHRRENHQSHTGTFSPVSGTVVEKSKTDESRKRPEVQACGSSFPGSPPVQTSLAGSNSLDDVPNIDRAVPIANSCLTNKSGFPGQQRIASGHYLKPKTPKPSKWDDAEKWIVNSGSPIHSQYKNSLSLSSAGQLARLTTPSLPKSLVETSSGGYKADSSHSKPDGPVRNLASENSTLLLQGCQASLKLSDPVSNDSVDGCSGDDVRQLDAQGEAGDESDTNVALDPDGVTEKAEVILTQIVSSIDRNTKSDGSNKGCDEKLETCDQRQVSTTISLGCTVRNAADDFKDQLSTCDQFTKDKYAHSIGENNGRSILGMKDAATEITPSPSQRDMGTQITPAQSFHSTTPPRLLHAGVVRLNTTPVHSERRSTALGVDVSELQSCHLAKIQLDQAATIDPTCNWNTREEEVAECAKSLRVNVDLEEVKRNVLEARATAWEESEQAKYMARYQREEAKILAWEAHQKAKAEAEMRKIEVKLERMRSHANEALQNKLSAVRMQAEDFRAAAVAQCSLGDQVLKPSHSTVTLSSASRSCHRVFGCFSCCNDT